MQRSEQLNELFSSLAKAQGSYGAATKETLNPHFGRRYADLASGWSAIREALSANGLAVVQTIETEDNGVRVDTYLGHSSGQWLSSELYVPAAKMDAQGIGSASTYGRRYALYAITGIAPEDDDGNAAVGDNGKAPPARQAPGAPKKLTEEQGKTIRGLSEAMKLKPAEIRVLCEKATGVGPGNLTEEQGATFIAYLTEEKARREEASK